MLRLRPVLGRFATMPTMIEDRMSRLPDEVVLQILSHLDVSELCRMQRVSRRYCLLARDTSLWKTFCFDHSRTEAQRRRQHQLEAQDSRLAELRNAMTALPGTDVTTMNASQAAAHELRTDPAEKLRAQRARSMANWEPGYPAENLDYYEEYVRRHAEIGLGWLDIPRPTTGDRDAVREVTGVGVLAFNDPDAPAKVIAPLDDGSICIWDVSARSTSRSGSHGRLLAQGKPNLLSGTSASHNAMTETGAVDCVSINSDTNKGFFAVQDRLHEVDLSTLQVCSTTKYPFAINALSDSQSRVPLTVGTSMTVHLHDPRDPALAASGLQSGGELIGGTVYSHAVLAQPGPLSILNLDDSSGGGSSIWVAGRFTSILNYDRRFFPRLRGTIHSGARVSSICCFPHAFVPRDLDLIRHPEVSIAARQEARSRPGHTIIAAAEYKGKGSLELYGIPKGQSYQNRQTASASKLLSVTPHGGMIVFSDGNGNLKWMERDAFSQVRTIKINDIAPKAPSTPDSSVHRYTSGLWTSSDSDLSGHGEIVQKIIPLNAHLPPLSQGRYDISQDNLLLWTGDGRLGILGFGRSHDGLGSGEAWHDALEVQAQTAEERAREDAERQYGLAMRRALERNADEVRFVRGLGMI